MLSSRKDGTEADDPSACKLLQMKAHPYFGVYSENYQWALPIGKF